MTRHRIVQLLAVVGIAAYLASCSYFESDGPAIKAEKDRKAAPDFTLTDADGKAAKLSDYKGKVVLLNFWATWCGPCQVEIPWFIQFQREYQNQDFAMLGVSEDDDGWKSVKPFAAHEKMNYRMMIATELVTQQYGGIEQLPTSFLIDREGRVASSHLGLVSMKTYRQEILTLLGSPKPLGSTTNATSPLVSENRVAAISWSGLLRANR